MSCSSSCRQVLRPASTYYPGGLKTCRYVLRKSLAPARPCGNAPEPVIWPADVHTAGHHVGPAVAIEVAGSERVQVRGRGGDPMQDKPQAAIVLEPEEARRARVVPV